MPENSTDQAPSKEPTLTGSPQPPCFACVEIRKRLDALLKDLEAGQGSTRKWLRTHYVKKTPGRTWIIPQDALASTALSQLSKRGSQRFRGTIQAIRHHL